MDYNKGHMVFTSLNLKEGIHNVSGYPPGFSERILAGALDEEQGGKPEAHPSDRARRIFNRSVGCPLSFVTQDRV